MIFTPLFLIIFAVVCILDIFLVEFELFTGTTISLVVAITCLYIFKGNAHIISQSIQQNYIQYLEYFTGYIIIAVIWSFIKWILYLVDFKDKFKDFRKEKPNVSTEEIYHLINGYGRDGKPTAAKNKGRIIGWMCFWPFSFVGTLLNDPVRKLFKFIYNRISGLYQKIADYVFNGSEIK